MGDLIASAGLWVTQFLLDVLPDSPITDWLTGLNSQFSAIQTGLGVLNVFVDVGGMKLMLGVWLVAVMAFYTQYFLVGKLPGILTSLTGAGGILSNVWQMFTQPS